MKRTLTIVGSLILSFLFVMIIGKYLFIGNTPLVNPQFIAGLANAPQIIASLPSRIFNTSNQPTSPTGQTASSTTPESSVFSKTFNKIAPGVYARTEGQAVYYTQNESEVPMSELTLTTNCGSTIKVKYPTNNPPVKQMLDAMKQACH